MPDDTGSSSSASSSGRRREAAAMTETRATETTGTTGTASRRPVVAGEAPPRLNVGVFSKHKGVRYHRDGQVRSCRFCEILRTRAEEFLFEDEHVVVFRPLRPIVPSHVLIVPRAHIRNVNQLARRHSALLRRMKAVGDAVVGKHFAPDAGRQKRRRRDQQEPEDEDEDGGQAPGGGHCVRSSFHVPPFNSIDHVHMHAFVDDQAMLGVYGRLKYRSKSWWCRSYDDVLARLGDVSERGPQHDDEDDEDDEDEDEVEDVEDVVAEEGGFTASSTPELGGQPPLLSLSA